MSREQQAQHITRVKRKALIALEVMVDLVICLSACPQDLTPCNAYHPTDLALRLWERAPRKA